MPADCWWQAGPTCRLTWLVQPARHLELADRYGRPCYQKVSQRATRRLTVVVSREPRQRVMVQRRQEARRTAMLVGQRRLILEVPPAWGPAWLAHWQRKERLRTATRVELKILHWPQQRASSGRQERWLVPDQEATIAVRQSRGSEDLPKAAAVPACAGGAACHSVSCLAVSKLRWSCCRQRVASCQKAKRAPPASLWNPTGWRRSGAAVSMPAAGPCADLAERWVSGTAPDRHDRFQRSESPPVRRAEPHPKPGRKQPPAAQAAAHPRVPRPAATAAARHPRSAENPCRQMARSRWRKASAAPAWQRVTHPMQI